jgi:hypothetical protein
MALPRSSPRTRAAAYSIQPLDRRISYQSCRAHHLIAHWAKRGGPRATNEPLAPSPLQLELDTTIRD